jgi:ribonucleoside-diphosphate reductase alpha chain
METFKHITLSDNATKVLNRRYLQHHAGGPETPEELFDRVAKAVAAAELKWGSKSDALKMETAFFDMMSELLFLPNSPTLMNAGTPVNQLSACFVLPVEDSIAGIFTTLKNAALVQHSGAGTGFNFSQLRPQNGPVHVTGCVAAGPVSFMKVFDAASDPLKYCGKRIGANIGILNIDHPDIEEFISAKKENNGLDNFEISIGITDDFMDAVEWNGNWNLFNPKTRTVSKRVGARELWQSIIENAWLCGNPGLVFLDTINSSNPLIKTGRIESTNPCGEIPLYPYEACNLGSINVAKFVKADRSIDWKQLGLIVHTAVRFLDDVIEINNYIVPETRTIVNQNRKIGLGIMGWADLLMLKEIPYDSDTAISLAENLMEFIQQKAIEASEELVKKRGCFSNWQKSSFYSHQPLRNATLLSIAQTGTIAVIADTSASIEPVYALAFERKQMLEGEVLPEINKHLLDYLKQNDLYSEKLVDKIKWHGNLAHLPVPAGVKSIFKTALEISPEWHLKHQVTFQKYVDNAVSKTIHLPETASVDDVGRIYKLAWQMKAKAVTVTRAVNTDEFLQAG